MKKIQQNIVKILLVLTVFPLAYGFVFLPLTQFQLLMGAWAIFAIVVAIKVKPKKGYVQQMDTINKMIGKNNPSVSHGSAGFAGEADLKAAGLFGESEQATHKGFIIGKFRERFLRFAEPGHLITFAPTRSGKGVGHVIPNCLEHRGSIVVNDIKGENYSISHEYRRKFSEVYSFAPFGKEQGIESNCYNPLDFIRTDTEFEQDDVSLIGDMVVVEEGKDPFWEREARNLIIALILHVATSRPPALRNMAEVQYLLMQGRRDFDQTLEEMRKSKNNNVRKYGGAFSATEPKVMASIMSVAKSQMGIWASPLLKAVTSKSNFDPADIKRKTISFYIIIPPEQLDVYKPVIRLMTGITIASMMRTSGKPKIPVLFLIDEFPALGYMKNIETGIGYLAGYGISLWLFIQDLSQLKANYEKYETFIANCAVRAAFGTNDVETAKILSEMLGKATITTAGTGISKDKTQLIGGSSSKNLSETARELMTPDEIMRMPKDTQVIFVQGCKPVMAEKIFYFKDPYFKGKFGKWSG